MRVLNSKAHTVIFVGGLGSGKTTVMATLLLKLLKYPGTVGGVFAPTLPVLKNATMYRLIRTLAQINVFPEIDYVSGKFPPVDWGIPKYTEFTQTKVMTFRNGTYVIADGLKDPDSKRGIEFDFILIDEFRNVSKDSFEVLKGRLRGQTYKRLGIPHKMYLFTTPPVVVDDILEMAKSPNCELITAPSWTNPNLPKGYLESLKNTYPDIIYRREVGAELLSITTELFAFEFDETKHVGPVPPILPDEYVYLSFDFNIAPATCTAWRLIRHGENRRLQCAKEFRLNDVSIQTLCAHIRMHFPVQNIIVTGDASGWTRQGATMDLSSFFEIIIRELRIHPNSLKVSRVNLTHRSSWVLCNSVLSTFPFRIDGSCKNLIKDLKTIQFDPVKGIDKSNKEMGHLLDTFRYMCQTFFFDYVKTNL